MRRLQELTNDELEWVKEQAAKLTKVEIADTLEIGKVAADILFKQLGLEGIKCDRTRKDSYAMYDVTLGYEDYSKDCAKFMTKVKLVKEYIMCEKIDKIGPYTIIKPYEYHCLVLNQFNCRESISYGDLSKYMR